jgi:hypothetical protein
MPTPVAERTSTAGAARGAAAHASAIARLEIRLALVELKQKLASIGPGAGLVAGAAFLGVFAFAFVLATISAGIATAIPVWAALLIMAGFLLAVTAILAALGIRAIRRGLPPAPEQAIREAKLTAQAVSGNGDHRAG